MKTFEIEYFDQYIRKEIVQAENESQVFNSWSLGHDSGGIIYIKEMQINV